ncbi:MAG: ATP-binding protein [Maricaulaceae bacterium]
MTSPELSVKRRLRAINILVIASALIGVMGGYEIARGAYLHKLNFLHVKYAYELNDYVASMSPAAFDRDHAIRLVGLIGDQSQGCLDAAGPPQRLAMAVIGTGRAIKLCQQDVDLATRTLDALRSARTPDALNAAMINLPAAGAQFNRNSELFEPLVDRTVQTIFWSMMAVLTLKGVIIAALVYTLSKRVRGSYEQVAAIDRQTQDLNKQLQQTVEALKVARDDLDLIFNHIPIRVWMKDAEGRLLRVNRAAAASLGGTPDQFEGRLLADFFPEKAKLMEATDRDVLASGQVLSGLIDRVERPDGSVDFHQVHKTPYSDPQTGRQVVLVAAVDITEQKRVEASLRAAQERLKFAMEGSSDGYWELDIPQDNLFCSDRFLELLNFDASLGTLSSADLREMVHPDDVQDVWARTVNHFKTRAPFAVQFRMKNRHGNYRWFRARGQAVWNDTGRAVRIAGTISDIEALVAARERAEAASRLKSEFLANMSHEIRTPMNGVLGMASALARTPLSDSQKRMVSVITESGAALLSVISDVLDFSKIEAGRMDIEHAPFDLDAVFRSVENLYTLKAHEKGLSFSAYLEPAARGEYLGDAARIRQILHNLVSNAIKFTEIGEVRVHGRRRRTPEGTAEIVFTVSDTGVGIAPDAQARLFDSFTQADASTTRKFGGTGLGLAICKKLCALMKGWIRLRSASENGSVFEFGLPLQPATQTASPDPVEVNATPKLQRALRVLIAEDNSTNQLVLRALLEPSGSDLSLVTDGLAAVEAWRAGEFDLILMDVQMPKLDGVDASRRIRDIERSEGRAPTPIIALTANAMTHQVAVYLEAGMDAHVPKPIDPIALFTAMNTLTGARPARVDDALSAAV